jgi:hypothetical protein
MPNELICFSIITFFIGYVLVDVLNKLRGRP